MKELYEKDLHHSWMIIETEQIYEEDYQMRMLMENQIPGLLEIQGQGVDEKSRYRYQISGKRSVKELWEKENWGYAELEDFMRQLIHVLYELSNYLLDVHCLSLKTTHIFKEDDKYVFCYIPKTAKNLWREFHEFMEDVVKSMNYEEKEGIYLAYELHKASMEESYDMEQVLEQILEKKEQEMKQVIPKKREMVYDVEEEQILNDWAGAREMTGNVLKDHQTVWGFVSKRIRKNKKSTWNAWESNPAGEAGFDESLYL